MFTSVLFSAVLAFVFVFVTVHATTIGTNVNTGGTLDVTGASTLAVVTVSGAVSLDGGAFTFNDSSADLDFRVESNGDANMLFVDGGNDRIGVKTATPNTELEVVGTASTTNLVVGGGNTFARMLFGTCSVNFPSIVASTTGMTTCSAAGVTTDFKVFVTPVFSSSTEIIFKSASSTAANTIQVSAYNTGAITGTIDPGPDTWSWMAIR